MATLKDIIAELGKRAKLTPEQIAAITGNESLASISVADDVSSSILTNLLSPELAVHNIDVKNTIKASLRAELLDPIDREMEGYLSLVDDEEWAGSWKANKSSYDKVKSMKDKLAQAIEAKVTAAKGSNASKEAQKQIEELSAKIKSVETEWQNKLSAKEMEFAAREEGFISESYYGRFPYANDKIPATANAKMAEYMIKEQASKVGAKVVYNRDKKSLDIVNAVDVSLPYMQDGKIVDFDTFANRSLAEAGLLRVNNPNPNPAPAPHPAPMPYPQQGGNGRVRDTSAIDAALAAVKVS